MSLFVFADQSCRYGNEEGNYPEATICKQKFSRHNMLTVLPDGTIAYETFHIPSACLCHIVKEKYRDYFDFKI